MVVARQMQENMCPICLDNEDGVGEAPPVVCSVCGQLYGAPFDVVLDDGSELNTLAMGMLSELQKCNANHPNTTARHTRDCGLAGFYCHSVEIERHSVELQRQDRYRGCAATRTTGGKRRPSCRGALSIKAPKQRNILRANASSITAPSFAAI